MERQAVYIVSAVRTPVGKAPKGVFRLTRPDDLLAHVIKHAVHKAPGIDQQQIGDVIIGCAMPEGEQGMNVARIGLLLAGLPDAVPGMTINRFCASGVQSIALAAERIALGDADLMIAGGVESMSQVPMGGNKMTFGPSVFADNEHMKIAYGMGITAELVAQKWQVSREEQDQFAYESHQRALKAQANKAFQDEIAPYTIINRYADTASGKIIEQSKEIAQDEGPRADTNLEALNRLRPVFHIKGGVTAGNASQMSDGAGAVLLASEKAVKQYGLNPIGRFLSFAVAGVPPEFMGIGPVKAIPLALQKAGIKLNDIDWIELNEAFAAQSLAVIKDLDLDRSKVNPLGGAIALGHPLGATGAIRAATVLHGLRRTKKRYGMVTMCIGTGMGAAGIVEAL